MSAMSLTVKIRNTTVTVQADEQKDLFQKYASAVEVFSEKACGVCGSENIRPAWRTVSKGKKVYEYAEFQCNEPSCRARLSMGSMMEGGQLFPIRQLTDEGRPSREEGKYGSHNGWTRFRGNKEEA